MSSIIIIDSQNKRVEINSHQPLSTAEILTELSMAEYALLSCTQDYMMRERFIVVPRDR